MSTFAPPQPHGPFEELFPDVFVVRGTFRVAPLVSVPRNMIVLRDGRALTLINSVRLSASGEAALAALGEVRHLVKLGHFHTLDDPYYRERFQPTYWVPRPNEASRGAERLVDGAVGPDARTRVFAFEKTSQGEAGLIVEQPGGNLLVTCDSVQHWPDTAGASWIGGMVTRSMGFLADRAKIGPIWAKQLSGGDPTSLWPDFERLLARDFVHLVAGHGGLLRDQAKQALAESAARTVKPR